MSRRRPARAATARKARRPKRRARRAARAGRRARALILRHAASAGVFVLTALCALAAAAAFYARDLPSTDGLWRSDRAPRVIILARDGSPLSVAGESHGAPVRLSELPPYVPQAVLALEDRNFYHHWGFNPVSLARALFVNAREGAVVQGGSTITQQLAKNLFLSADRTVKRKVQELMLALWLEHRFTKDEILTLYLNRVYFGAGAYGVDAASRRYFGKPAAALDLGEAAVLAGLLKAPSRYSPTRNPDDAGERGRLALDAMVEAGFLAPEEAARARARPIALAAPAFAAAPYFVDHVLQEAAERARGIDADLLIRTTFDPKAQAALETGLAAGLALGAVPPDVQVAAVVVDRDGAVRAMVGGRDYRKSQFNRAAKARRQPGSAFKPVIYLAALEAGFRPEDVVLDAPVAVEGWRPDNYRGRYYGEVTLAEALARSLNAATVRVQEATGRAAVRRTAHRLGLAADTQGPALALGVDATSPLALAGAYAALANGGARAPVHAIVSIETVDGQIVWRRPPPVLEAAASPEAVARLNAMLKGVVEWGTGRAAAIPGLAVAGKTGTTQMSRDAWFAGHAGGLAAVVWMGRDDNAPMGDMTGGRAPAIVWREAMSRLVEPPPRRPAPLGAPAILAPLIEAAPEPDDENNPHKDDPLMDLLRRES